MRAFVLRPSIPALLFLALSSGCSVDMFSGGKTDPEIADPGYRKISPECSGLKLDRKKLDGEDFRKVVQCLNSNRSIPEIASIVSDASTATLARLARVLHVAFLSDESALGESRGIIRNLSRTGTWEANVSRFSYLLEDPDRVRAAIRLFSFKETGTVLGRVVARMDPRETARAIEIMARLVRSPAFRSLHEKLMVDPLPVAERKRLVELLAHFLSSRSTLASAQKIFGDVVEGKTTEFWSYALGEGSGPDDARVGEAVFRLDRFFEEISKNDASVLRDLSRLHQGFRRPISCWDGGKVFQEPWKNLAQEFQLHAGERLLPFILRFTSLTAIEVRELCRIPAEFLDFYPTSRNLAVGPVGAVYVGLLDRLVRNGAGESSGYFVGEWGELLAEVLGILGDQVWFPDLILLVAELDADDRDTLASWFRHVSEEIEEWEETARGWKRSEIGDFFSDFGDLFSGDAAQAAALLDSVVSLFESSRVHPWFAGWKRILLDSSDGDLEAFTKLRGFDEAIIALNTMARDGRLASMISDLIEFVALEVPIARRIEIDTPETPVRRMMRHGLVGESLARFGQDLAPSLDESLLACARLDIRRRASEQWSDFSACSGTSAISKSAADFFDRMVRSWVRSPLSVETKRELVTLVSGNSGLPGLSAEGVRAFWAGAREYLDRSYLDLIGKMRRELGVRKSDWDSFSRGIADLIRDPEFAPTLNAIRRMRSPKERTSIEVYLPNEMETLRDVGSFECTQDPAMVSRRAVAISEDFENAVLGWKWDAEGRLPTRWDPEELEARIGDLSKVMGSRNLRRHLYRFLSEIGEETVTHWFFSRASDPVPVALMDPETRMLRVRWMTSLDRLESILVNSDFRLDLFGHEFGVNYGLKFIGRFAEAWGDEPRASWPKEIQRKYSGRDRPPTLSEVYEEVSRFLSWFEKLGGMPALPDCVSGLESGRGSGPAALLPFEIKSKVFNLKQTLSVIFENLPNAGGTNADGMRFLRNLFWAIYSSVPASERRADNLDGNPLRFLQRIGDLGGLRQISKAFQAVRTEEELDAIRNGWISLSRVVLEPSFDRLVERTVLDRDFLSYWIRRWGEVGDSRKFDRLVVNGIAWASRDRYVGLLPGVMRIAATVSEDGLPYAMTVDLMELLSRSTISAPTPLHPGSDVDAERIGKAKALFERRVEPMFKKMPLGKVLRLLEEDPELRAALFRFIEKTRQSSGGSGAFMDLFLSEKHPEIRMLVASWCADHGGRFVDEWAMNSDETFLIFEELLRSAESEGMSDFLEALLRQLPH